MTAVNSIIAILCITAIEIAALKAGINGVLLAGAVAAIAGLGGFATGRFFKPKEPKSDKKE